MLYGTYAFASEKIDNDRGGKFRLSCISKVTSLNDSDSILYVRSYAADEYDLKISGHECASILVAVNDATKKNPVEIEIAGDDVSVKHSLGIVSVREDKYTVFLLNNPRFHGLPLVL